MIAKVFAADFPAPVAAAGVTQLEELVTRIIFLSVGLALSALTVMLVIAAFRFLTSAADKKTIASAWATISWAFLGILFMGIAWVILLLVGSFTGLNFLQFSFLFPNTP
jgi:hypothetical protein